MVRSPARHQADPARRQLGEDLRHRTAPKLRAQHRRFGLVDPMHLKDMLGGVQTNPDNPHRTAPLLDCTITAWHYRCRRGAPTPTFFSASEADRWVPASAGTPILLSPWGKSGKFRLGKLPMPALCRAPLSHRGKEKDRLLP